MEPGRWETLTLRLLLLSVFPLSVSCDTTVDRLVFVYIELSWFQVVIGLPVVLFRSVCSTHVQNIREQFDSLHPVSV